MVHFHGILFFFSPHLETWENLSFAEFFFGLWVVHGSRPYKAINSTWSFLTRKLHFRRRRLTLPLKISPSHYKPSLLYYVTTVRPSLLTPSIKPTQAKTKKHPSAPRVRVSSSTSSTSLRDRSALLGSTSTSLTPPGSGRSTPFGYNNTNNNDTSYSNGQRYADDLEGQNDEALEGLSAKVKLLKDVGLLWR